MPRHTSVGPGNGAASRKREGRTLGKFKFFDVHEWCELGNWWFDNREVRRPWDDFVMVRVGWTDVVVSL